ncbi:MAG: hypothetical protein ACRBM6_17445 [Geminicoccales bacterium]
MFADPNFSDDVLEKIVAFIDREAGRDAPLTPEDEAMVRDLLLKDAEAQRLAEDLRTTNAGLDTLLDDVAAVQVPDKLVSLIRSHASNDVLVAMQPATSTEQTVREDEAEIVELRPVVPSGFGYGGLAAAASLLLFASLGALLHVTTTYQDDRARFERILAEASATSDVNQEQLADASAELARLSALSAQSVRESELANERLARRNDLIQRLETGQATLQNRYDQLAGENEQLAALVDERNTELATLTQEQEQVTADLSVIREALAAEQGETKRVRGLLREQSSDLTDELASTQQRLAELSEDLEKTLKQSAADQTALTNTREAQRSLQNRLASLEAEQQNVIAERDDARQQALITEQQVNALQANLAIAESARQAAVREVASLGGELTASKSWLNQIAQYHRVYASTARRHLVEVGADEQEHIEQWLAKMLKRPIPVPDLSAYGVTFQGARLLGINENPVAQLVYLDADDQPLALCIIPSTKEVKALTASANRDLNVIDWRDGQHGFAVVGWSDNQLLTSLAEAIRPLYDL